MVDLHCHILSGIDLDDGAQDMKTSMDMLRTAAASGVDTIVATPHFHPDYNAPAHFASQRQSRLLRLREAGGKELPNCPRLLGGAEVELTPGLPDLDGLELLCMEGTSCLLVELPKTAFPLWVMDTLYRLQSQRGITPILAHPERHYIIQSDPQLLYKIVQAGTLAQLDAPSLYPGRQGYDFAKKLISHNVAHFISSDGHNDTTRKMDMTPYLPYYASPDGENPAQQLLRNGDLLIEQRFFQPDAEPIPFKREKEPGKSTVWNRLKSIIKKDRP